MGTHNICFWGEITYLELCLVFFLCMLKSKKFHPIPLTFTTLWAFSVDDKLIFFLFFPENRI